MKKRYSIKKLQEALDKTGAKGTIVNPVRNNVKCGYWVKRDDHYPNYYLGNDSQSSYQRITSFDFLLKSHIKSDEIL